MVTVVIPVTEVRSSLPFKIHKAVEVVMVNNKVVGEVMVNNKVVEDITLVDLVRSFPFSLFSPFFHPSLVLRLDSSTTQ